MIIDYKKLFVGLIVTLLLTIPVATALKNRTNQFEIERSKNNQLQIEIKKRDSDLEKTKQELQQQSDEADKLKQKNEKLEKDLQAKLKRKAEEQKIAAAPKAAVGVSGSCESYRGLVAKYFPADQINNALLTMQKESGCRPTAVSPTNDHGLMQINCTYHCSKVGGNVNALYDPETNVKLAADIYAGRGWTAWYAVRGILW